MENTTTPSTAVAIVGARGRGKTTVCNGLIRETMARLGRDDDGAREARGGVAAPVREVRAWDYIASGECARKPGRVRCDDAR